MSKIIYEKTAILNYFLFPHKKCVKGTFFSEIGTDFFVITPNRRTFFFPETENLNFGDGKLLRN